MQAYHPAVMRQRCIPLRPHLAHAIEAGAGPAVVVLASMLVCAESYRPLLRRLSRRFRTIVAALPGSGRASALPAPWEMTDYARAVTRLMDALGLARAVLVGHSNSAAPALLAAAHNPQRVSHLVLADPIGFCAPRSLARVVAGRATDALFEPLLSAAGYHHVLGGAATHRRNFFHQVALSAATDLRAAARDVRVPTLLAWGRWDLTMPLTCARPALLALPRATLHVSETGSHDWLITRPAEFAAAVSRFVATAV